MWIGKFGGLDDEVESLLVPLREGSAVLVPSVLVPDEDGLQRVVLVFVDLLVFVDFPPHLFFILHEMSSGYDLVAIQKAAIVGAERSELIASSMLKGRILLLS